MSKAKKRKAWALTAAGLVLAAGCEGIPLTPGETAERSCAEGNSTNWEQSDQSNVVLYCDEEVYTFNCPDGLAIPTQVDLATLRTECASLDVGPPVEEDFEGDLTRGTELSPAAGYCSGGHGWVARTSFADRQGSRPDRSSDQLNWRITVTVTWCVIGGAVQCGLSFIDVVEEGRMHEKNDRVTQITPCGTARRDTSTDWDFEYGFCPWCVGIDVDLTMWVSGWGTYGGKWTHNGDGY